MKHCCFRYDYDPSGDTLNVIPDFTPDQAPPLRRLIFCLLPSIPCCMRQRRFPVQHLLRH